MTTAPFHLGFHGVPLYDPVQQLALPLLCFYPTQAQPQARAFGPFTVPSNPKGPALEPVPLIEED